MITSTQLQAIGYTLKQSHSIMRRLKELHCPTKTIRVRRNYVRKEVVCDLIMFCDAIDADNAIVALRAYLTNLPKECNRAKWENIFKTISEYGKLDNNSPII